MKAVPALNSMPIAVALAMGLGDAAFADGSPPYQASGVKVGGVALLPRPRPMILRGSCLPW